MRLIENMEAHAVESCPTKSPQFSRQLYPGCPPDRPEQIPSHACQKCSGRIGRSAAAKRLDEEAVQLAVVAHVRHDQTHYDELLSRWRKG